MAFSILGSPKGGDISKAVIAWIKTIFGPAFTVSRGYSEQHDGVDLAAPIGTPVYALRSGIVSYAKNAANDPNCASGWACNGGNVVNLDISGTLTTQFAHLNTILVQEGQKVYAGQQIGTVGKTGFSTGPHLHFGLWDHSVGKMIDPSAFLNAVGDTGNMLGAWGNIVSFPIGHIITMNDIDTIMKKLGDAGFFTNYALGFMPGEQAPEAKTRQILIDNALGKAWNKDLQDILQAKFFSAADLEGQNPLNVIGTQIADTFTWLGIIFVGIALAIGGIILIRPSGPKEE